MPNCEIDIQFLADHWSIKIDPKFFVCILTLRALLIRRLVVREKQKRQNLKGPSVDFFENYIFE